MKIITIVETDSNLIYVAPFCNAISEYNNIRIEKYKKNNATSPSQNQKIEHILIYTDKSSDNIFSETNSISHPVLLPEFNLGIDLLNNADQINRTIIALEKVLKKHQPNWIVLFANSNISLACSVTAKKNNIKVCLFNDLASFTEKTINETNNYLMTLHLSDLILLSDKISYDKVLNNGIDESRIRLVGNARIDIHELDMKIASTLSLENIIKKKIEVGCSSPDSIPNDGSYDILTLQLPMNIDNIDTFNPLILFLLSQVKKEHPLIWPIHPSTRKRLINIGLWNKVINNEGIILLKPVTNIEMLRLNIGAQIMLADSVYLQEECCVLGTPCITLRWITESQITLRENGGTSILVGIDIDRIKTEYFYTHSLIKNPVLPELWDGHAAERCLEAILLS